MYFLARLYSCLRHTYDAIVPVPAFTVMTVADDAANARSFPCRPPQQDQFYWIKDDFPLPTR